ncbi:Nuclear pore complex protein Nup85 [Aphelenchoides besseyi]|nr:Nuclear pore complex protein Nup85 [Aphelenchoides besseyi]
MEVGSGVAETKANRFFRDSPSKNTTFFGSQVTKTLIYDLHELARTNNEILRPENAILISQHYRMAIRTALQNVQDNDREKKELVLHRELYNADVLWSLTEAVYIQSTVIDLINWGLHCFGNAAKTICDQVVEKADAPETHQYYWNAKVRDSLRNGTFKRSSEELEVIVRILIGKMESFEKCGRSLYDFWYELLPAYVLFTCPGADLDNIGKIAQTRYQTLCPTDTHVSTVETMNTEIDRPIFSILCKKLPEMLKQICENSVSWWFPVHLCDLFQKLDPSVITMLGEQIQQSSGRETANFGAARNEGLQPQRQRLNADEIVRTSMIIDYGTALLESYDFWNISYSYVLSCGAENATYELDSCLVRLSLDSVKKAERLYAKDGHYNEALSWALRSELSDLINLVSNKMLSTFDARPSVNCESPTQLRPCSSTIQICFFSNGSINFVVFSFEDKQAKRPGNFTNPSTTGFIQLPELDRDSIYDLMKAANNFELRNAIIRPSKAADSPHTVELPTEIKFLRPALCSGSALRSLS